MDFIKQHKLLVLILVVVLVAIAWYEFTQSEGPAPVLTTANVGGDASSSQDAQLVSTLLQLQAVTLSGTIFTDPGFLSLQDYTTQIVSEPIGRPNPFAPIAGESIVEPTSTTKLNPNLFAPKASDQ